MVTLTVGMTSFETLGQQQNTTNTTSTASNQTQGAIPSSMANLIQSDFEELTDNLNAVREAIQDNDLAEAMGELGSAETEVKIFMTQVGAEIVPVDNN
jgi:flagellin-like hook-associated protein FlgL